MMRRSPSDPPQQVLDAISRTTIDQGVYLTVGIGFFGCAFCIKSEMNS